MKSLPPSASRLALKSLSSPTIGSRATFICASCRSQQPRMPQSSPSWSPSRTHRRGFTSGVPLRDNVQAYPSIPPSSGYARLRTRRLIAITGADAPYFLQGLITTSIEGPKPNAKVTASRQTPANPDPPFSPWFYCGFLNAKGRVLHDVFIYPVPPGSGGEPHFMIEVDAAQLSILLQHLRRFKLRSKVFLRAVEEDEMSVWQVWSDGAGATEVAPSTTRGLLPSSDGRSVVVPDLRAPDMGCRILTVGEDLNADAVGLPAVFQPAVAAGAVDESAYRVRRYLQGVPEGGAEIVPAHAVPHESNMDVMGAVDFHKGCYLGQELTIRTHHRGVVRKRILPCVLYGGDEPVPTSLEYKPDAAADAIHTIGNGAGTTADLHGLTIGRLKTKGRSTGTFLAGVGNIGLALCRVQLMTDLVVPNDTAALEFDPTAEFVLQPREVEEGQTEEAQAEAEAKDKESDDKGVVKVKAFVPEWLRQRLNETAVKH